MGCVMGPRGKGRHPCCRARLANDSVLAKLFRRCPAGARGPPEEGANGCSATGHRRSGASARLLTKPRPKVGQRDLVKGCDVSVALEELNEVVDVTPVGPQGVGRKVALCAEMTAESLAEFVERLCRAGIRHAPTVAHHPSCACRDPRARVGTRFHPPSLWTTNPSSSSRASAPITSIGVRPAAKATASIDTGAPAELPSPEPDEVTINNMLRGQIDAAMAALKLFAPERDLRLAAARPLQSGEDQSCLLYTSPSPRNPTRSRQPSSS